MKRNLIFTIASAVLLFTAASCAPDNFLTEDSFISLNLSSRTMETKAAGDGEDEFNENSVNSVYYFFYKKGGTSEAPVIKGRLTGLGHKSGVRTEEIPVSSEMVSTLFEQGRQCDAFIVANPPKGLESFLNGSPTLKALRSRLFVSSLKEIQESFMMVFDATVAQSSSTGNIMTVDAKLRRLAGKVSISLNTAKTDAATGNWESVPGDARVTFFNMFNETALSGDFGTVKSGDSGFKEKYYDTDAIAFGEPFDNSGRWTCRIERPVYTYPQSWEFSSNSEPYILLELPWRETAGGTTESFYYKLFFNSDEFSMNNWYHIAVNIDDLGSRDKEDPEQLFSDMEYMVLDWNDAFETPEGITTEIGDAKYLMTNRTEYILYNQEAWNIPFVSSHECELVEVGWSRMNYRTGSNESGAGSALPAGEFSLSINGNLVTFYHKLNNDFSSTDKTGGISYGSYDIAPYTFTFTLRQIENPTYKEEITIVQYPAVYIQAQANSVGSTVKSGSSVRATAFVNISSSYYMESYGQDPNSWLRTSRTLSDTNGNMYVVTTSTAPGLQVGGKDFMLADPRSMSTSTPPISHTTYWDTNDNYSSTAALGQTTNRRLTNYYPAKKTADAENQIAPKLRIASAWGQSSVALTKPHAEARCAAYQEDGYPAGRWRLPTAAELLYVSKLSSDHMIPMLFGNAGSFSATSYWCSTGYVSLYRSYNASGEAVEPEAAPAYTYDPTNTTATCWVRCVYDEWYWENNDVSSPVQTTKGRLPSASNTTRYWGDLAR